MQFGDFQRIFAPIFAVRVADRIAAAKKLVQHDRIAKLLDQTQKIALNGGKRARPMVLALSFWASGGEVEKEILEFGVVVELLHTMALIHDDIIDHAPRRHGEATAHFWAREEIYGDERRNVSVGQAILLGDLWLSRVYDEAAQDFPGLKNLGAARKIVHQTIEEVVLGQMIDVDTLGKHRVRADELERKNLLKSARYSFVRPMLLGATLAGADETLLNFWEKFGEAVGLAYQVRDDLLDVAATETDKRPFSDVQEGQQTFLSDWIWERGTPAQQEQLRAAWGKKLDSEEIAALQKMFAEAGAIDAGRKILAEKLALARKILAETPLPVEKFRRDLEELVDLFEMKS